MSKKNPKMTDEEEQKELEARIEALRKIKENETAEQGVEKFTRLEKETAVKKKRQLTEQQKDAVLQLGSSSSLEAIPADIFKELISLNIVYKRSDGNFDFTEEGEAVYKKLKGTDKLD